MSERFGTLRALMQQAPSEAVWRALREELALWGETRELEEIALPYALDHLARWPARVARWADEGSPAWVWRAANSVMVRSAAGLRRLAAEDGDALLRLELGPMRGVERELRALWRAHRLGALRELRARGTQLGDSGVRELLGSPAAAQLTALALRGVGMGVAGVQALAESARLESVRELDIGENHIGTGLAVLMASRHLGALEALELREVPISRRCAEQLAQLEWPPRLARLGLKEATLGAGALEALADAAGLACLRRFSFATPRDEAAGLAQLMSSPSMEGLRELELGAGCELAVAAAARNHALRGLERLTLRELELERQTIEELRDSPMFQAIHTLELEGCIGDAQTALFEGSTRLRSVHILGGGDAQLTDEGAWQLARCEGLRQVELLELSHHFIEDQGAQALAMGEALGGLRALVLHHNWFEYDGLLALTHSEQLARLEVLDLSECGLESTPRDGLLEDSPLLVILLSHPQDAALEQPDTWASVRCPGLARRAAQGAALVESVGLELLVGCSAGVRLSGEILHGDLIAETTWRVVASSPHVHEVLRAQARRMAGRAAR